MYIPSAIFLASCHLIQILFRRFFSIVSIAYVSHFCINRLAASFENESIVDIAVCAIAFESGAIN